MVRRLLPCVPMLSSASSQPRPVCLDAPDDPEADRLLRLCDPGAALTGPLSFLPPARADAAVWLSAWQRWQAEIFGELLAPMLASAASHAAAGRPREMRELNEALASRLDDASRARSAAAGHRLLRRLGPSRGDRWLGKFLAWEAQGALAAHFPIVYAGQNAFFHLPLRALLPTYAYWEWSAAVSALPPRGPLPRFSAANADLQSLVDRTLAPASFPAAHEHPGALQV